MLESTVTVTRLVTVLVLFVKSLIHSKSILANGSRITGSAKGIENGLSPPQLPLGTTTYTFSGLEGGEKMVYVLDSGNCGGDSPFSIVNSPVESPSQGASLVMV